MTQAESNTAVLRWVLPFLEVYLAADPSYAPFLVGPPPPGFVLQSQL